MMKESKAQRSKRRQSVVAKTETRVEKKSPTLLILKIKVGSETGGFIEAGSPSLSPTP
jgi:hypothetical protein